MMYGFVFLEHTMMKSLVLLFALAAMLTGIGKFKHTVNKT